MLYRIQRKSSVDRTIGCGWDEGRGVTRLYSCILVADEISKVIVFNITAANTSFNLNILIAWERAKTILIVLSFMNFFIGYHVFNIDRWRYCSRLAETNFINSIWTVTMDDPELFQIV